MMPQSEDQRRRRFVEMSRGTLERRKQCDRDV